jgi:hypothetical protein
MLRCSMPRLIHSALQPFARPGHQTLQPVPSSAPMPRFLLAISLSLFASAALAGEVPAADGQPDATTKTGKVAAVVATQDGEASTPHPAAPPARTATPHVPRWHSLLPGMIR